MGESEYLLANAGSRDGRSVRRPRAHVRRPVDRTSRTRRSQPGWPLPRDRCGRRLESRGGWPGRSEHRVACSRSTSTAVVPARRQPPARGEGPGRRHRPDSRGAVGPHPRATRPRAHTGQARRARQARRLASTPGGWIVVEDYDTAEVRTTDHDGPDHELLDRMLRAFNKLLAARGASNSFGANALRHLRDRGLVDTGASGHVVVGTGGDDFARVVAAEHAAGVDGFVAQGVPEV